MLCQSVSAQDRDYVDTYGISQIIFGHGSTDEASSEIANPRAAESARGYAMLNNDEDGGPPRWIAPTLTPSDLTPRRAGI